MTSRFLLALSLLLICHSSWSQSTSPPTLYLNAVVHTAAGEIFEEGALGVRNGKIDYVGRAVAAPKTGYDSIIDLRGKQVYPALISTNTTLGINEIDALRATNDFQEAGRMNPNVRAISAYNAESEVVATTLSNGILFAQVVPQGGVLSGTSSVVALSGWNWEDAAYHTDEGTHLHWPKMYKYKGHHKSDPEAYVANDMYEKELEEINQLFEQAQAYAKRSVPMERDLRLESMRGLFDGSKRLYVHADFIKELREISHFKKDFQLEKLSIVGGYDSWMALDLLREANISVLLRRVNSLPRFAEDPIDGPYRLPAKLAAAKVLYCIEMGGGMETSQNRNLPFNAGTAVGYGLSKEDALKAVTINAAKILGIDSLTGSLEVGKEANFVVSSGDIFEIKQSKVEAVYFRGEALDLENRQDML
jgi:imidazolonepropionase-like amidohydrolase